MKVLVCGAREWTDRPYIQRVLEGYQLQAGDTVIHGDCRGADRHAGHAARELGCTVVAMPADWEAHGKGAGPIRNQQMLDEHPNLDLVLAFHRDIDQSKGTKDMIARAEKAGLVVDLRTGRVGE